MCTEQGLISQLQHTEMLLTSSLDSGFAAQDKPKKILGYALIVSLIRRAIRLGLLEVANQKRAISKHDVVLVFHNQRSAASPLCGDGWDPLHLTVQHQRLFLNSDDVTGLQGE